MPICDLFATGAIIYYAPLGTTVPADTVAAGVAWGGAWINAGYTSQPVTILYKAEKLKFEIEQALAKVKDQIIAEEGGFETVLAEITLTGMSLAWGGTVTPTGAGVGQPGKEELPLGGLAACTERMWGIEGKYVDEDGATFPIRAFFYIGVPDLGGELKFSKKEAAGIALKVECSEDLTKTIGQRLMKISKILEPAT